MLFLFNSVTCDFIWLQDQMHYIPIFFHSVEIPLNVDRLSDFCMSPLEEIYTVIISSHLCPEI